MHTCLCVPLDKPWRQSPWPGVKVLIVNLTPSRITREDIPMRECLDWVGLCVCLEGRILIKLGEVVGGYSLGEQSWTAERTRR